MPAPSAVALDYVNMSPTTLASDEPVVSDTTGAFWEMTLTTINDPFFDRPSVVEGAEEQARA